jgi:hypothetical protein
MVNEKELYSLMPLDDFKAVLGIDDREDKLARFCLVTSTFTIEQYCKRWFLRKKYFETIEFFGDLVLPLREYPVTKMLAVFSMSNEGKTDNREQVTGNREKKREKSEYREILETDFYRVVPDCGSDVDIPFSIEFSPAVARMNCKAFKVIYYAGYAHNSIPADLSAACLELASWNMNRYRGRRVGMTGNIRGAGKEGEHFEMAMPENVRTLLEPYRRKTI